MVSAAVFMKYDFWNICFETPPFSWQVFTLSLFIVFTNNLTIRPHKKQGVKNYMENFAIPSVGHQNSIISHVCTVSLFSS